MTKPGFLKITLMGYISSACVVIGALLGLIIPVSVLGACLVTAGIVLAMVLPNILRRMSVSDLEFSEAWILPIFLGAWLFGIVLRGLIF
jgi:hypothetical protein|tara:strand:+ start:3411 stop:3677 length:267 start_codon:yes stop_codon:yes gene_type:complete